MTAWYQLANNGQRKLVILAVMGLSIIFTGCPSAAKRTIRGHMNVHNWILT